MSNCINTTTIVFCVKLKSEFCVGVFRNCIGHFSQFQPTIFIFSELLILVVKSVCCSLEFVYRRSYAIKQQQQQSYVMHFAYRSTLTVVCVGVIRNCIGHFSQYQPGYSYFNDHFILVFQVSLLFIDACQ